MTTNIQRIVGILTVLFAGISFCMSGCDKSKDTEETEETAPEPAPAPEPEPEPAPADTSSAAPAAGDDEVTRYPEMTKMGGTRRLLKSVNVHQAADLDSKKLTGLARNTLVDLKGSYGSWVLVDWPSGPGTLSPGWIHIRPTSHHLKTVVRKIEAPPKVPTPKPTNAKTPISTKTKFKIRFPGSKK